MVRVSIPKCRTLIALLLVGAFVCGTASAGVVHRNPKKKSTRQIVESLEEQWRQAQLNGDVATLDHLLSDDFVGITASGQVTTKAQQLSRVRDHVVVLSQLDISDVKVKTIGPIVAVVTSRAQVTGVNEGAPIKGSFRYTRVYQRLSSGAWKITSFEATREPAEEQRSRTDTDVRPAANKQ